MARIILALRLTKPPAGESFMCTTELRSHHLLEKTNTFFTVKNCRNSSRKDFFKQPPPNSNSQKSGFPEERDVA